MDIQLRVTQRRSGIGRQFRQKRTLVALGLRKINHSVIHNDTPQIRGMIATVRHLVEVEQIRSET